jgi:hypothetical protein
MLRILIIFSLFFLSALAWADDDQALAKKTQNPVADLISVPFQNNFNFGVGPDDDMQYLLNIQPVVPQSITPEWNWIHRAIVPIINQPEPVNKGGMGDIQYQGFLSPADPGEWIWGVGPVASFPTATNDLLGTQKWSLGPTAVLLQINGSWVYGVLVNNLWSVGGDSDREDVNTGLIQYFVNYNFPGGLYLSTAPINTVDWEADSDNRWTVPLGGGVGKIIRIGKLPLNTQLQSYYNVETPDQGAEWQIRFQVQFLFPR